jgi:hypothetical protein
MQRRGSDVSFSPTCDAVPRQRRFVFANMRCSVDVSFPSMVGTFRFRQNAMQRSRVTLVRAPKGIGANARGDQVPGMRPVAACTNIQHHAAVGLNTTSNCCKNVESSFSKSSKNAECSPPTVGKIQHHAAVGLNTTSNCCKKNVESSFSKSSKNCRMLASNRRKNSTSCGGGLEHDIQLL